MTPPYDDILRRFRLTKAARAAIGEAFQPATEWAAANVATDGALDVELIPIAGDFYKFNVQLPDEGRTMFLDIWQRLCDVADRHAEFGAKVSRNQMQLATHELVRFWSALVMEHSALKQWSDNQGYTYDTELYDGLTSVAIVKFHQDDAVQYAKLAGHFGAVPSRG